MSKWTPGPWCAHHNLPEYIVPVADADKKIGATVNEWERHEFARVLHRQGYPCVTDAAANARLIAEAPAMAEELAHLLALIEPALESGVTIPGLATMNRTRALLARIGADE